MKARLKFTAFILLAGMVVFASCRKSPSSPPPPLKQQPVARAGDDQIFTLPPDSITLDGSASTDPDGRMVSYQWSRVSGPVSIAIVNGSSPVTAVRSIVSGTIETGVYQFELKVTDNDGLSSKASVTIIVRADPVADAGADQTITLPTNSITLDGRNGSLNTYFFIVAFSWTKISGPNQGTITNSNTASTIVTGLVEGTYSFRLLVTDTYGATDDDTVSVNVMQDPLSGQEFIFDNLTWEAGDFFGTGNNDIYVGTPDRPDLFDYTDRPMEVSIRFDNSAVWINVPRTATPLPANSGYLYDIYSPVMYVFAVPVNDQIIGTNVSIKVKFL